MTHEAEYVLGTNDEEVTRLGLQHRVWRQHAVEAWGRAGFTAGQTLLDIGCGPGFASLDLAAIAGPSGRVIAIDKSSRFLTSLQSAARLNQLSNITCHEIDLDRERLPVVMADGAWARWAFAFVRNPRALVHDLAERLEVGGTVALHEYFDYGTWRTAPRSPELEDFVGAVIASWRESGGEPDVALDLPRWLEEAGFDVVHVRPIVDVIGPGHDKWQWLAAFIESGRRRLVDLGAFDRERSEALGRAVAAWEASPSPPFMVTPAVLEIVAVRRA
jgi:SAM-dependent methyltransferase